jgi:hypothetical protein
MDAAKLINQAEDKMDAKSIFDEAIATVDINDATNWKFANAANKYPSTQDALAVATFLAIENAIHKTNLGHREKRAMISEFKTIVQSSIDSVIPRQVGESHDYLMKPQISAISNIVTNAIQSN